MYLLRYLYYYVVLFSIQFREHVPGLQNSVPDSLSCNLMQVFRVLVPHADPLPTPIPDALTRLLEGIAQRLVQDSLTVSSQRAYSSAQNAFKQFCHRLHIPAMTAQELVLLLYVAELSQQACHAMARAYLSAIQHMHLVHGFSDPLLGRLRLEVALKAFKRRRPRAADQRLPTNHSVDFVDTWSYPVMSARLLQPAHAVGSLLPRFLCIYAFSRAHGANWDAIWSLQISHPSGRGGR